nr:type IX secretion system membrane protein PorP/SprF [uncultured Mucilaginibacter sp.]
MANYSTLDACGPFYRKDVRETEPDIGFGAMLYGDNYYVALSVPELSFRNLGNTSVQQANYLHSHYYFSGGFLARLNEDVQL